MYNDIWNPILGLNKTPDSTTIKSQNIEIGMLNSTIDELEYDISILKKDLNYERKKPDISKIESDEILKLTEKLKKLNINYNNSLKHIDVLKKQYQIT